MHQKERIQSNILPNGLRVVFDPIPEAESVSIGIQVGCGSYTETAQTAGYSHFIEHIVFKGTKNRNYIQINKDIEKYGGYLNAYTDKRYTFFYVKMLPEYLMNALDVLTDLVCNPIFPIDEIEKEKMVVLEEISMYEDNPDDSILELFFEHSYSDSFMGWPVLGTRKIISDITRESIVEYWENLYQLDNMIISVSGKYDEEKILGYLNRLTLKKKALKKENAKPQFSYGTGYKEKEVEQAHMAIGVETFSLYDERKYALNLLNIILGADSSSRLYLNIREKLGLCYSISSSVHLDEKSGLLTVFTSSHPKQLVKIMDAIMEEIKGLKNNPITREEIEIGKAQMKSDLIFNYESNSYRMQKNANQLFWYNKIISYEEMIQKIENVEINALNDVYEEIFQNKNISAFVILPHGTGRQLPKKLVFK